MKLSLRRKKPPFAHTFADVVPIVNDAAIATGGVGEGRLVPVVILDTTQRPDLEELIRIHQHLPAGDVTLQWAKLYDSPENVILLIHFKRPSELNVVLKFDIPERAALVDQILTSRSVYLQGGKPGDRFIHNPDAPKILMEIPDLGFNDIWNKIFEKSTIKRMRESGLSRGEAKAAAKEFIEDWRKFGRFRMKR